jgi:hypothetical protein
MLEPLPPRTAEGARRYAAIQRDRAAYRESLDDDPSSGAWADAPPIPQHILEDQLFTYVPGEALEALAAEIAVFLNPSRRPDPDCEADVEAFAPLVSGYGWAVPCAWCSEAVKRPKHPRQRPACSDHCRTQAAKEAARLRKGHLQPQQDQHLRSPQTATRHIPIPGAVERS